MLLKATLMRAVNEALFFVQPAVLGSLVFVTYHLLGNVLSPQKVSAALPLSILLPVSVCHPLNGKLVDGASPSATWISSGPRERSFKLEYAPCSRNDDTFPLPKAATSRTILGSLGADTPPPPLPCSTLSARLVTAYPQRGLLPLLFARCAVLFLIAAFCGGDQVFTTLALLNITQFTMGKYLYQSVQASSESWISIKRLEEVLLMEVRCRPVVSRPWGALVARKTLKRLGNPIVRRWPSRRK